MEMKIKQIVYVVSYDGVVEYVYGTLDQIRDRFGENAARETASEGHWSSSDGRYVTNRQVVRAGHRILRTAQE